MRMLAIDPGTEQSGFVIYRGDAKIDEHGVEDNYAMRLRIGAWAGSADDKIAIEMVASYGMSVGAAVFETVRWIGRFEERWSEHSPHCAPAILVYRMDVKMHLCKNSRAKDTNIRQALIDRFGEPGTKKNPGGTYGIKSHAWPALAVAVTAWETKLQPTTELI